MSDETVQFIEPHELDRLIGEEAVTIIDVREAEGEGARGNLRNGVERALASGDFDIHALFGEIAVVDDQVAVDVPQTLGPEIP